MTRFFVILVSTFIFSGVLAAENPKDKMVLRYVVRSTRNGDTELSISAKDGSVTVKRELQELGCPRTWDKTCFAERTYTGKMPVKKVRVLIDDILNKKLFDMPKEDNSGQIEGDQYAIGLLIEGKEPRYANSTDSRLDKNRVFNGIKKKLQSIVDKYSKI